MARILLGWELGSGFGHVGKLVILAQALQRAGHRPVLALAQIESTRPIWEGKGVEVIGAPAMKREATPAIVGRLGTFADTLTAIDVFALERLVTVGGAWKRILDRLAPDVVVCESAPSLALVARGNIPMIIVGTGYSIPPPGRSFPVLRFWEPGEPSQASISKEKALLANLNRAAARLGVGGLAYVADAFGGDDVFVTCLPELDCYAHLRTVSAIGSLDDDIISPRRTAGGGLFAYFKSSDDLPRWLEEMAASGIETEGYVRGSSIRPSEIPPSIRIHTSPVDLVETVPKKGLIFHHGGMTTTEITVRVGVPQLILPTQLEQRITAIRLATHGGASVIDKSEASVKGTLAARIAGMAHDEKMRAAAADLALTIAARSTRPALDIVVEAIAKYIA